MVIRHGNQLDILREQMAKLPQFQENKEKFSVHLEIVNGCLEYIQHNRIVDISNLEQVQRRIHRCSNLVSPLA